MRNFLRISQGIEVMPLLMEITRNQDWWHADDYLRSYPQGPFAEVDSIILRFPARTVYETEQAVKEHLDDKRYDPHECIDQPIYAQIPVARILVMRIFSYLGATRLGRVMINRIKPGGRIFKHADTLEHALYWQRHHIVLQSAPGAFFEAGNENVYMAPGELWWFNNGKPDKDGNRPEHQVINNSAVERIHLIMDCKIP